MRAGGKNDNLSLSVLALGRTGMFLFLLSYMTLRNMEWKNLNATLEPNRKI